MSLEATLLAYKRFAERKNLPWISPSPLVNAVDHKAFNYSLEEPILREFSSYLAYTHRYTFSTVQPCIRGADVGQIKKAKTANHLVLFHIFPTAFSLSPNPADLESLQREAVSNTVDFLSAVGIDLSKLKITYFAGGRLDEISGGKVPVSKTFPADSVTCAAFRSAGFQDHQLTPTAHLDTFVATFAGDDDFLAGNRFEIYHPLSDGTLLEIGTGEALRYRQVRKNGVTIDVLPASCCAAPVVIGLERLQAVLENRSNVRSISALVEVADQLSPLLNSSSEESGLIAADFFRAAHLILAQTHDTPLNSALSEQRRVIISHLCKQFGKRDIQAHDLLAILERNAALHPWLPELASEAGVVAKLLVENIRRRRP